MRPALRPGEAGRLSRSGQHLAVWLFRTACRSSCSGRTRIWAIRTYLDTGIGGAETSSAERFLGASMISATPMTMRAATPISSPRWITSRTPALP